MKTIKPATFIAFIFLLASCGDDSDTSQESVTLALNIEPQASVYVPGRFYFDHQVETSPPGYASVRKVLTITHAQTGEEIHRQAVQRTDHSFSQVDLEPGTYRARLTAMLADANVVTTDETSVFDDVMVTSEYLELPLSADISAASQCIVDEVCKINIEGLCALPDQNPVAISCSLSTACQSIDIVGLQSAVYSALDSTDCGRTIYPYFDTPLILWARGGSGATGANAPGDPGASGHAMMFTSTSGISLQWNTESLLYALGQSGSANDDFDRGAGGAATVMSITEELYPGNVVLVAGGGGGGEDTGFDPGDAGLVGGVALSKTLDDITTGQGGGGSRGGGQPDCEPFVDCGGSSKEHSGGDGMAGHGGTGGAHSNRSYWSNIPSDDMDEEGTWGYWLANGHGQGGDGHAEDFIISNDGDPDGGGGGGYGGGGGGDADYGGGGGGGSFTEASALLPDYIDYDALEDELNTESFGEGEIHLIWVPLKSTP